VLVYLYWTGFGSRCAGDAYLRFRLHISETGMETVHQLLGRHCRSAHLVSQRFQGGASGEVAFRLAMRDPSQGGALVEELQQMAGVSNVTLVGHEEQAEV